MKYIEIAGLSKKVSQLILGTDYYRPDNLEDVSVILDEFVRIGGNTIDTAYVYQNGESERAIGLWLQSTNARDDIVVLTKGAHTDPQGRSRMNKEAIYEELMTSLERLQTDYIDLYALHRDDPTVEVGVILDILNEHIEAGRIRAIGVSNWTVERLQEAKDYAEQHGLTGFSFNSPNLSLAKAKEPYWPNCVSVDDAMMAWHHDTLLPLLSWSSQARGFFSGLYSPENRSNEDLVRVFYSDDNWARYERAEQLGKQKGYSIIQIALAYVLNQRYPTSAIIGPRSVKELHSSWQALDIKLSAEELDWLENGL